MADRTQRGSRAERRARARHHDANGGSASEARAEVTIPKWLPPLLFVLLTSYLFRTFVFSDQMLFGQDTLGLGYVARAWYAGALRELGTIPGWAPLILGGTPFVEALAGGDSLYPPSLALLLLLEPYRALGWKLVLHVAAAGFFMFGWIRTIGASRAAALLGGTAYMLAPVFVSFVHPGHDGKMFVIALAPLLFRVVERHFVTPRVWTFGSIALVIGLILLTTHFQMAYFLFGAVGLFAIFRTVEMWRGGVAAAEGAAVEAPGAATPRLGGSADVARGAEGTEELGSRGLRTAGTRLALFLLAAVLGAGVGAVQLVPAVDYVVEHSRRTHTTGVGAGDTGVAWSSSWSIHPEEALALIVPEFAGNDAGGAAWAADTYWGRNAFKDNHEYAGLVVLLLAAASFAGGARRRLRWFFTGLGVMALLFSLGAHTPVWRIFYEVVPGIRLFRAPSQAMFLFGFGAVTLAALGLDRMLELMRARDEAGWTRVTRTLAWAAGAVVLLALLIASGTFTTVWTSTVYADIHPQLRQTMDGLLPFMARGAGIAALLAAAVWGLARAARAGRLPAGALVAGLVSLVALDALRVDGAFIQVLDFHEWAAPDPNIQSVLEREQGSEEPYRLLSFRRAGQDVMPALHGIELAAGHHPNDLARYRELIGMEGSSLPRNLLHPNVRRILNVRYLLWPDLEMGQSLQGAFLSQRTLADGRPYETMFPDDGLPRARLVGSAVVRSDAEAVAYILSDAFDPESEVVLPEAPDLALTGGPVDGAVEWLERTANRHRLSVSSDRPALLVVADNWFPAWRVTVDGAEAPLLRANHALRAVPVPAGESTVEMEYASSVVATSFWISLLLTLGLGGATIFGLLRDRRRGDET